MRDVYLNDIGDYVKYALLRELAGASPEGEPSGGGLGVLWYRTVHEEKNNDGSRREYLGDDDCDVIDPPLFAAMRSIEESTRAGACARGVDLLRSHEMGRGYLPRARFYAAPLEWIPGRGRQISERRKSARDAWWEAARLSVSQCPTVFLDPDNGLRPRSVKDGYIREPKYCRRSEVVALAKDHDIVVVYQHGHRSTPWDTLRSTIVEDVRRDLRGSGLSTLAETPVHTLVASAFVRRGYLCFARSSELAASVSSAIKVLIDRADSTRGPLRGKLQLETD